MILPFAVSETKKAGNRILSPARMAQIVPETVSVWPPGWP
jgi:hypothetical protein